MHVGSVTQPCLILCNPTDYIACQAPLPMGFFQQEYWGGLSFPPPGDRLKPESPAPPSAGGFFTSESPGNLILKVRVQQFCRNFKAENTVVKCDNSASRWCVSRSNRGGFFFDVWTVFEFTTLVSK